MADVVVTFSGDSTQLEAALSRVQRGLVAVAETGTKVEKAGGGLTSAGIAAGVAAASVGLLASAAMRAASGVAQLAVASWNYANAIQDMSERTGLTVAQVAVLQRVAASTGTEIGAFEAGLVKLNLALGRALTDGGAAAKEFANIGLSLEKLRGQTPVERLLSVADALAKIKDTAVADARATDFFGRSSARLRDTLGELRQRMAEAAEGFDAPAFAEHVKKIDEATRKWDLFATSIKEGAIVQLAALLALMEKTTAASLEAAVAPLNEPLPKAAMAGGVQAVSGFDRLQEEQAALIAQQEEMADATKATNDAQAEQAAFAASRPPPVPIAEGDDPTGAAIYAAAQAAMEYGEAVALATQNAVADWRANIAVVEEHRAKSAALSAQIRADLVADSQARAEAAQIRAEASGMELELIKENADYELMLEQQKYDAQLAQLEQAKSLDATKREEYRLLEQEAAAAHEDRMLVIRDRSAKAQTDLEMKKLDHINKMNGLVFGNLATMMNSKNKKLFEVGKVAAIAQATVATYTGATQAFSDPTLLTYEKFAAAGSIIAAGLVNIQKISSTQFGSSGGGGGGGGGSTLAGAGTGAQQLGPGAGSGGGGKRITVNLNGSQFSRESVEDLIRQINEAEKDGIK